MSIVAREKSLSPRHWKHASYSFVFFSTTIVFFFLSFRHFTFRCDASEFFFNSFDSFETCLFFSKRNRRVAGFRSNFRSETSPFFFFFPWRRKLRRCSQGLSSFFPNNRIEREGILESGEFSSNFSNPFPRVST